MQKESYEIQEEQVFRCPICGSVYETLQEAENCAAMGQWNQKFDTGALLWKWNIFKPSRESRRIVALIPKSVNARYTWTVPSTCCLRTISLFSADSSTYWEICRDIKIMTLSFMDGFDRYRLVPPVRYIRNLPDEKADEIVAVLKAALELRQGELISGGMSIDKDLLALSAFECSEFTHPIRLSSGKVIPPLIDPQFLPQTQLITEKKLYQLEEYIPDLVTELEW